MARNRDLPQDPLDELRRDLERLKLSAMLAALDGALEQAQTLQQGYTTFLAGLVRAQAIAVAEAAAERRRKAAGFPVTRTFDGFDFAFQPGLNVQLVKDLMSLNFIRQARPVLILGKPGTGKTHLSLAYGHLATLAGFAVRFYPCKTLLADLYASLADGSTDRLVARLSRLDLLIIDDLRHLPPRPEYASLLADVVEARHQQKATILSSNLSVTEWGRALGNPVLTASVADRLMERAHVINIRRGRSYRTYGPEAPPEEDRPAGLDRDPDEEA
jgi:DNA replication protein DnaC